MGKRPFRCVPAAVSPIQYKDLLYAVTQKNIINGQAKFENSISNYLGVNASYSFTSFMRAIYACLSAIKIKNKADEIILPRYSCPSFSHAILAAGLKPRYCDVITDSLTIDFNSLKLIKTKNILGLICVNFFGFSNPMDKMVEYCKKNNIYLIEDIGYSLGTEYKYNKLGSFGDFSVLNFQEGKSIPVGGGMVSTNNVDLIQNFLEEKRPQDKSNISIMFGYKLFSNPYLYSILINGSELFGKNIRKRYSMEDTIRETSDEFDYEFDKNTTLKTISSFQGVLGYTELSKIERFIEQRQKNALILEEGLSSCDSIELIKKDKNVNKIHYIRYPILVKNGLRNKLLNELFKNGIEASLMYSEHGLNISSSDFPGSYKVSNEILTLPCHPNINENDLNLILNVINNFLRKNM